WRADAATNKDNVAWFYYCGHGVQLSSPLLLATDYNKPRRHIADAAIEFQQILDGMIVSADFSDLARRQFYLVDACRSQDRTLPQRVKGRIRGVWTTYYESDAVAKRVASVLFATGPGEAAFGQDCRPTPFARALIRSLRNDAADSIVQPGGGQRW